MDRTLALRQDGGGQAVAAAAASVNRKVVRTVTTEEITVNEVAAIGAVKAVAPVHQPQQPAQIHDNNTTSHGGHIHEHRSSQIKERHASRIQEHRAGHSQEHRGSHHQDSHRPSHPQVHREDRRIDTHKEVHHRVEHHHHHHHHNSDRSNTALPQLPEVDASRTTNGSGLLKTKQDHEFAVRQTRYETLTVIEKREQEQWAQAQIRLAGCCPVGFNWYRMRGGYMCGGGAHIMTDYLLSMGNGGYYVRNANPFRPYPWVGPIYPFNSPYRGRLGERDYPPPTLVTTRQIENAKFDDKKESSHKSSSHSHKPTLVSHKPTSAGSHKPESGSHKPTSAGSHKPTSTSSHKTKTKSSSHKSKKDK